VREIFFLFVVNLLFFGGFPVRNLSKMLRAVHFNNYAFIDNTDVKRARFDPIGLELVNYIDEIFINEFPN
jgi:hypothetical protein